MEPVLLVRPTLNSALKIDAELAHVKESYFDQSVLDSEIEVQRRKIDGTSDAARVVNVPSKAKRYENLTRIPTIASKELNTSIMRKTFRSKKPAPAEKPPHRDTTLEELGSAVKAGAFDFSYNSLFEDLVPMEPTLPPKYDRLSFTREDDSYMAGF